MPHEEALISVPWGEELGAFAPWRNIKKFGQLRFLKSFWHRGKHCSQWRNIYFKWYSPVQWRYEGNI